MFCGKIKSQLNRYLDGEISPKEQEKIELHVESCASCREELSLLRMTEGLLQHPPEPPDIPAGFTERAILRYKQRFEQQPEASFSWSSLSPVMRLAAAITLVFGLGLGGLMSVALTSSLKKQPNIQLTESYSEYGLDYFSDAPKGSLSDACLTLTASENGGNE
jgi:anti-sigma factor RsiW